ncbi:hypothetical protein PNOK_0162600 [Pyrrhoderma noxium]|uniref:Uncharacterized protein n=1 Tax=Pyrrhoderma noxium TaxID=2282107 RepID=A0A286UQ51_9AGAM|nr:hypothetical protein PNOK_0162600 [Pyrrhoderma noxium]
MPAFRKSPSTKSNFIPYLMSASSKLNLSALSSTSSLSALFSSSTSASGSSRSIFKSSGTRGVVNPKGSGVDKGTATDSSKEKENSTPTSAPRSGIPKSLSTGLKPRTRMTMMKKKKKGSGACIEISGPTLTPDSLEHVHSRFTLVPLSKLNGSESRISEESYGEEEDDDIVVVEESEYREVPGVRNKGVGPVPF